MRPALEVADIVRAHGDEFRRAHAELSVRGAEACAARHRTVPHSGARRPSRTMRPMRPRTQRIQLVRGPPLPQVPVFRQGQVVGETAGGTLSSASISMSCLRCQQNWPRWPSKTNARCTICYFGLPPIPCSRLRQIRNTWGRRSAFSASCTRGGKPSISHPHLHCVVPGGGISLDGSRWVACRPGFFLPVNVLSRRFRKLYLRYLEQAYAAGKLQFHGELQELSDPKSFARYLAPLPMTVNGWSTPRRHSAARNGSWIIWAAIPIGSPSPTTG